MMADCLWFCGVDFRIVVVNIIERYKGKVTWCYEVESRRICTVLLLLPGGEVSAAGSYGSYSGRFRWR